MIRDPQSEVWSCTIQFWSVVHASTDRGSLLMIVTCIQLGKCGNFCDYSYNYLYYYQARFRHKIHFQSVWQEQILNFRKRSQHGFAQKSVHREVRTVGQVVQLSDFTGYKKIPVHHDGLLAQFLNCLSKYSALLCQYYIIQHTQIHMGQ